MVLFLYAFLFFLSSSTFLAQKLTLSGSSSFLCFYSISPLITIHLWLCSPFHPCASIAFPLSLFLGMRENSRKRAEVRVWPENLLSTRFFLLVTFLLLAYLFSSGLCSTVKFISGVCFVLCVSNLFSGFANGLFSSRNLTFNALLIEILTLLFAFLLMAWQLRKNGFGRVAFFHFPGILFRRNCLPWYFFWSRDGHNSEYRHYEQCCSNG